MVHIYRHVPFASQQHLEPSQPSTSAAAGSIPDETTHKDLKDDSQFFDAHDAMLAVLAVPSWMSPSDFLGFVAPAVDGISHLRMIRYDTGPTHLASFSAAEKTNTSTITTGILRLNAL